MQVTTLTSYQGVWTTSADSHFVTDSLKVAIDLHIPHTSFEWLYGDVKSARGAQRIQLQSDEWQMDDGLSHNTH